MKANIKNVYLTINVINGEQKKEEAQEVQEQKKEEVQDAQFEDGVYEKDNAPDGVYIVTDREKLILPEFWGLHKYSVTPIGVAVIEDGKRILIDMQESDEELQMLSECKSVGKEYGSSETALKDFDGEANTEALAKENSPAAPYCMGKEKHLPSLGEMKLANKHRELVDAALVMIGGTPFKYGWYWTSTQYASASAWILFWSDGLVYYASKNYKFRVRAFSNF